MKPLILASSSRYRRALLARLGLAFEARTPGIDETARDGETPAALAARLALEKARAVGNGAGVVIGSDQVAEIAGRLLRKPGSHEAALAQLRACRGQKVGFLTATAIVDETNGRLWQGLDRTDVYFAERSDAELASYLHREQPYDCVGGFKAEGLGVALFERIESSDPTALVGLPLIWVAQTLRDAGLNPLG
jgi:septum formation protein